MQQNNISNHMELRAKLQEHPFAIFGAGIFGRRILGACRDIGCYPVCFIDNYKAGDVAGTPIISLFEFMNRYSSSGSIIISLQKKDAFDDVKQQLGEAGFSKENILYWEQFVSICDISEPTWDNTREDEYDWSSNDDKTELLSHWIDDTDESVADFGCGARMYLRRCIPQNCKYIPVDYVSRSEDTIVVNFNEALPDIDDVDVAYVSGVLPYIKDHVRFLNWICQIAKKKIILSMKIFGVLTDEDRFMGAINGCQPTQVEQIIKDRGFKITEREFYTRDGGIAEHCLMCFERL